jgi:hypothetical protein
LDIPEYSEESYKAWDQFLKEWHGALNTVIERLVPKGLRTERIQYTSPRWQDFIAVCVLYQPPDTELVAFAKYAMPAAEIILSPSPGEGMLDKFKSGEEEPRPMVLPPIKQIRNPSEDRALEARHWAEILETVWELYIEPQGLDFEQMLLEACHSDNHRKRIDEWNNNKPQTEGVRYYIEIDQFTTEDDVRRAFRMLSAAQKERPRAGRPKRDRLTCVECAVLHDRHGWAYEQLAQRYGWKDSTLTSKYIADGRNILRT